ncbi:hypothetical protein J7355_13215 [Endozoicomonas sp. G2_2]|uniref:hypothetical protein n=1 Tax=Endozoicomonas sp. G2_2 TaxID=2821092 RepID=UPI001ADB0851|nr:hypothetical protein [Endozoicomonas sp. G2_2]MBO9471054.1 hypothetical protein [Endozoicomonas sp. G2_2]
MIRLQGTVTAVSPISVSYPDHQGLPRTPHGEVMLHGGTFRGPLRKASYRAVRQALAHARGVPESEVFTLRDAYMLGEGVDTTRETSNEAGSFADPIGQVMVRENNPLMDLFGRWKLAGRLAVGELRTSQDNVMTAGRGARSDMFERDSQEVEYLSPEDRDVLLSQLANARETQSDIATLDSDIKKLKREAATSESKADRKKLNDEIKAKETQKRQIKEEREGASESIKHPLAGFESIAPGSEMSHRMTLISGTDTDLGMLLLGLAEFARHPFLGGHRNTGLGEFSAEWEVLEWLPMKLKPQRKGVVKLSADGLVLEGEELERAFENFVDGLTEYDFQTYTVERARAAS